MFRGYATKADYLVGGELAATESVGRLRAWALRSLGLVPSTWYPWLSAGGGDRVQFWCANRDASRRLKRQLDAVDYQSDLARANTEIARLRALKEPPVPEAGELQELYEKLTREQLRVERLSAELKELRGEA